MTVARNTIVIGCDAVITKNTLMYNKLLIIHIPVVIFCVCSRLRSSLPMFSCKRTLGNFNKAQVVFLLCYLEQAGGTFSSLTFPHSATNCSQIVYLKLQSTTTIPNNLKPPSESHEGSHVWHSAVLVGIRSIHLFVMWLQELQWLLKLAPIHCGFVDSHRFF